MNQRVIENLASMQRAQELRRKALEVLVGALFGLVLLVAMAAPWDRLS